MAQKKKKEIIEGIPKVFGYEVQIDLENCNPNIIKDEVRVQEYINQICSILGVKKHGESIIERFGDTPEVYGITFVQMITVSLISGHLVESDNSGYINVFSCSEFDVNKAVVFSKNFFEASGVVNTYSIRY